MIRGLSAALFLLAVLADTMIATASPPPAPRGFLRIGDDDYDDARRGRGPEGDALSGWDEVFFAPKQPFAAVRAELGRSDLWWWPDAWQAAAVWAIQWHPHTAVVGLILMLVGAALGADFRVFLAGLALMTWPLIYMKVVLLVGWAIFFGPPLLLVWLFFG